MAIDISDEKLQLIKSVQGFPVENEVFLLTDDQIKQFCVEPALRQYFAKFPKIIQTSQNISYSEEISVDYYNEDTYGVVDARITHQEYQDIATGGFNSFIYLAAHNQRTYKKNFGIKGYNPNSLSQASEFAYQALRSRATIDRAIRIYVDVVNRKIIVFSNRSGKLLISWALYSENFSDVRFNYIQDVIELSQGYLLKHAARTTGMFQNTNMPLSINYDFMNSEGDALITKVNEKWNEIAGILLIKS